MISTRKFCGLILGFGACLAFGGTPTFAEAAADKPQVVLDTTLGKITLELDPEKAPITVENFLKYVDDGFYDNLVFHRVISGFMVQTGGMSDKLVEKHEGQRAAIKNESGNGLSNKRGTIAMARTNNPNSATSQFFINHADNANLDRAGGGYAVFGKVIDGLDVVDAIAKVETTTKGPHGDVPVKPIYIKSATRVKK
ncbi:MAG: peptidylprolyl isomerase [Paludisphaera borealis]|uniref:peptidylprolyl isomerase n=1 Tax=Paludisphaera borealis TaxID=1387353 RepID=UPI00283EFD62|nr:peptidylprolyl isomerase [Paludisphaera borealis]MDR3618119.1 peptidylprolyl isomerase [Paludisphaera borealis]